MARRKRSKKWISWVIILLLLVAAGVISYLVWDNYFNDKKNESETTPESSQEKEKEEEKPAEKKEEEQQPVEKEKTVQYDGANPNTSSSITGAITYAAVSGNNLVIRVNIDQYLNGGKCTLGLRQGGGNVYSAEAAVIDSASTSTCEGFNVPVSGLPGGEYNIIIYINSGDKTGEISGGVTL